MVVDLNNSARPLPDRHVFNGRYVEIQPLDMDLHGDGLFEVSSVPDAHIRFQWLFDEPPQSREEFQPWLEQAAGSNDPLYFVIIDQATGKIAGRQALMRIKPKHGVLEFGHVYWGPLMSRKPAATEAFFLFADYVFNVLGYRRLEWKCHNHNEPSKRAAERFGFQFEGIFRQHMIIKGESRDTAWYSILDKEWIALRQTFEQWLSSDNFDQDGQQKRRLEDFRID